MVAFGAVSSANAIGSLHSQSLSNISGGLGKIAYDKTSHTTTFSLGKCTSGKSASLFLDNGPWQPPSGLVPGNQEHRLPLGITQRNGVP